MLKVWRTRDGEGGRAGGAFQFERLAVKITRWRVVLGCVAAGSFLIGLVAMAPAEIVTPRSSNGERQAVGTVWAGERALPGGFGAGWSLRPFASLFSLAAVERIRLRGPDTEATAEALVRPGRVLVRDLEGTASMRLLNAVAPAMPFVCDPVAQLDVARLSIRGAPEGEGTITTSAGQCALTGGGAGTPVPALAGTVTADEGSTLVTLNRDGSGEAVMQARVQADGGLTASIEAGGVGLIPGMTAPVRFEGSL
ncbi:hypothetical protein [Brevundimonas bacteroides]|uniref:hypothetical protein n=1 Tax=Brevundimonas bacteroides TaxID=74311 RepID=UPI0004984449|nr:hypothetical protein [Brevundimonas bacteroides]